MLAFSISSTITDDELQPGEERRNVALLVDRSLSAETLNCSGWSWFQFEELKVKNGVPSTAISSSPKIRSALTVTFVPTGG